jgi:O-antigen/teichoic acid export membrane protein
MTQISNQASIAKLALRSTAILATRATAVHTINFFGTIMLSQLFSPEQYGFIAVISGFMAILSLLGNLGLGSAIIKRENEPSIEDFETTFFVHLAVTSLILLMIFSTADGIANVMLQNPDISWPIRIASMALLGSAFQAPPRIALQRRLDFGPIASAETIEVLCYYVLALLLGLLGYGIWSIALAIAIRSIVGIPFVYRGVGHFFRPRWHGEATKKLIAYGAVFQGSTIVNTLRESTTPIIVSTFLGSAAAGYWGWAWGIAQLPLSMLNELWRIGFPAFARLPKSPSIYKRTAKAVLSLVSPVLLPISLYWAFFGPDIIILIFGERWLPAHLVSAMVVIGLAISGPISTATAGLVLIRDGASRILTVQISHTITFWTTTFLLIPHYGLTSLGIGWICSSLVDGGMLWYFSGDARPSLKPILVTLTCAVIGLFTGYHVQHFFGQGTFTVIPTLISACITYLCMLALISRNSFVLARHAIALATSRNG